MNVDPTNPVGALCAAGMAIDGDPDAAQHLFEQAWQARQDDYDATVAAHFVARHQSTLEARVQWNATAAQHAECVTDGRVREFKASLYLNLADSYFAIGDRASAALALSTASTHLLALTDGGYRTFVERGIAGLQSRLAATDSGAQKI